ncbi:MAG: S-layer homology domain-containing protein [Clostridiales bacterium]|nr:S-layer homology domain-containing protein [Clostridiales bacterium]
MKKMRFIIGVLSIIFAFQSVNVWADDSYSSWAEDEIKETISLGLIPEDLQSNYTNAIIREEFCILVVNMLEKVNEDITARGSVIYFDDTDNGCVTSAAALGIAAGVGNNKFNPDGNITRQEAARMLYTAATVSDRFEDTEQFFDYRFIAENKILDYPHIFSDTDKIDYWAAVGIEYCYQRGIMFGVGENSFDPGGTYSREQAYLTVLRLYKRMGGDGIKTEIMQDSETGLFGYVGAAEGCIYDRAYRYCDDKAVVVQNGIYKLIDRNGQTLIDDISLNIHQLSEENTYIYDCCGSTLIVLVPSYSRLESGEISYYFGVVYDAYGEELWQIKPTPVFTSSGNILYYEEASTSLVLNETAAYFQQGEITSEGLTITESITIYKK